MKLTARFIEDAIKSGWRRPAPSDVRDWESFSKGSVLLDPLAWQAVGKTRGWRDAKKLVFEFDRRVVPGTEKVARAAWRKNMHQFIDQLAGGKTIEEALAAVLNRP